MTQLYMVTGPEGAYPSAMLGGDLVNLRAAFERLDIPETIPGSVQGILQAGPDCLGKISKLLSDIADGPDSGLQSSWLLFAPD